MKVRCDIEGDVACVRDFTSAAAGVKKGGSRLLVFVEG